MSDRVPLICAPTPCHALPRLSAQLGLDLWIKRDDLTGFAGGGNKGRKLEFLLPKILASGADTVVTCGATQSNFVRHLAVTCRMFGLEFHAITMPMPFEEGRQESANLPHAGGNRILVNLSGGTLHEKPNGTWDELDAQTEQLAADLRRAGRQVFVVPLGGSSVEGAYAFRLAAQELPPGFDSVVCPTSSGSTHAGLSHAFAGTPTKVLGVACDPEPELVDVVADLCQQLDDYLGMSTSVQVNLNLDFVGDGYGFPSEAGEFAMQLLAQTEGIFLDPIYGAKAFAGLLGLAEKGELKGRVCYWHTGGFPSLFVH